MKAFLGEQSVKDHYLSQLRSHYEADEIVHGVYWQNGKGCAVGCTIHSSRHVDYETLLGIPQQLAHIEDRLFESLPNGKAKEWPIQFLDAIQVGADLRPAYWQFMIWLLVDPAEGVLRFARTDNQRGAISAVAQLFKRLLDGGAVHPDEWAAAAYAAATAAAYAAAYAAEAGERQAEKLLELLRCAPGTVEKVKNSE